MASEKQIEMKKSILKMVEEVDADTIILDDTYTMIEGDRTIGRTHLAIHIMYGRKPGIIPCCKRMEDWVRSDKIFKNIVGSFTVPSLNDTITHCPHCGKKIEYRGI